MPDTALTDARTTPAAVWTKLEGLKGEELAAWRIADLPRGKWWFGAARI
jgi:hypothetical protein